MIEQLPEIPRLLTAVAEWSACVLFMIPLQKRFSKGITVSLYGLLLVGQGGLQLLAGTFSEEFWILGMIMNVALMFAGIWGITEQHIYQTAYWCADRKSVV